MLLATNIQLRVSEGPETCGVPAATDAAKVDSEAYAPLTQPGLKVRWLFGQDGKVAACQRSDGRWHYLAQPLSLQLNRTQG